MRILRGLGKLGTERAAGRQQHDRDYGDNTQSVSLDDSAPSPPFTPFLPCDAFGSF